MADNGDQANPSGFLQSRMQAKGYNVLFICHNNAVHSIMAEALLKRWGGAEFCAFSAGINPTTAIDPLTVELLKERRVWHAGLQAKSHREFFGHDARRIDFVITVGECPPDGAPKEWPGSPQMFHWHITSPDPRAKSAEIAHAARKALTELETRIKLFVLVYQ